MEMQKMFVPFLQQTVGARLQQLRVNVTCTIASNVLLKRTDIYIRSVSFLILLCISSDIFGQELMRPFKIIGNIAGIDTGRFIMLRLVDSSANSVIFESGDSIINGKFTITGKIAYPHAFLARVYKGSSIVPTEYFFIEPGTQYLNGHFDSILYTVPLNTSKTNQEFLNGYWPQYKLVEVLYDVFVKEFSLARSTYGQIVPDTTKLRIGNLQSNFITRRDSLILQQASQFPDSFVSLWVLAERFFTVGYKEIYEKSFNRLSSAIKLTRTGKFLGNHMKTARITAKGQKFPLLNVVDVSGKKNQKIRLNKKYTLLDFWFSHCGPCIAQFAELKDLYKDFNVKGFNIIGLSTDRAEDKASLNKAILKYELPWKQLWDKNAVRSFGLTINAFPTNFLLDENGVIIEKNISPVALKNFLQKNL